eukprot:469960_1
MPSFNVGAGSYEYFLSFNDRKYTEHLDGYLREKRSIPKSLQYICSAAFFFLLMHLWHFFWNFLNAHFPEEYIKNRWYFEFDIVLILWQSVFMISLVILLTSVVHKDSQNIFHEIIVMKNSYKLVQYIFMIISSTSMLVIPIAILSFYDEDIGTHYIFHQEKDSICNVILCEYLYLRFILIYIIYPSCIP